MQLSDSNYFCQEANNQYMSASQFKTWRTCEALALAELKGLWVQPCTTALLVGQYVDSHFSGTTALFRAQHPDIYKRDGSLKAEYEQANNIIQRIEADALMTTYLSGQPQVIKTGQIAGVDFKIKMDSYHPGQYIVDLKIMRNLDRVWKDGAFHPFVEAWSYDFQAAVYQRIEGNHLPFILAVATKDDYPDIALLEVPQDVMDDRIAMIEDALPRIMLLKLGLVEPVRCEKCDYCKATKILTTVVDYREIGE